MFEKVVLTGVQQCDGCCCRRLSSQICMCLQVGEVAQRLLQTMRQQMEDLNLQSKVRGPPVLASNVLLLCAAAKHPCEMLHHAATGLPTTQAGEDLQHVLHLLEKPAFVVKRCPAHGRPQCQACQMLHGAPQQQTWLQYALTICSMSEQL